MKNVNELLKKEQQAREILANIGKEKEDLAIKKLTELKEILAALDCSHLLENSTVERIVEKEVEKIVEVPGPIQVVKDVTEIDEHLKTIADQQKEIEKLKKTIATMQKNNAKIKESVNETKLNNIENMPITETYISEEEDYIAFLSSQEDNYNISTEEKKNEELNIDTTKPQFVKMVKNKVGKNTNAKLFQTEKCYLIASPTTDEVTWLSNEVLSEEYKIAVENILVDNHKFLSNRTKLSPIKINRENAYMARASAVKGTHEFSMEDVLVGYVKLNNKFYLYSYRPKYARPNVDSLDAVIANKEKTMPQMSIVKQVTEIVIDMYKEYKALVETFKEQENKIAEENAKAFNEKVEARRTQREEDEALIANAGLLSKIKKNNKKKMKESNKEEINITKNILSSSILDDIENELF